MENNSPNLNVRIGERVRRYRKIKGITMETLGSSLPHPVSGAMMARYETGGSRWPADLLCEIATFLEVDIRNLTVGE